MLHALFGLCYAVLLKDLPNNLHLLLYNFILLASHQSYFSLLPFWGKEYCGFSLEIQLRSWNWRLFIIFLLTWKLMMKSWIFSLSIIIKFAHSKDVLVINLSPNFVNKNSQTSIIKRWWMKKEEREESLKTP